MSLNSAEVAMEVARCTVFKERVCEITEAYARLVVDYERLQAAKEVLQSETPQDGGTFFGCNTHVSRPLREVMADIPAEPNFTEEYLPEATASTNSDMGIADERGNRRGSAFEVVDQGNNALNTLPLRISRPTHRMSTVKPVFSMPNAEASKNSDGEEKEKRTSEGDVQVASTLTEIQPWRNANSQAGSGLLRYASGVTSQTLNRRGLIETSNPIKNSYERYREQLAEHDAKSCVQAILSSHLFEGFMAVVILFNTGLMVKETDDTARCYSEGREGPDCLEPWINIVNLVLLILYTLELLGSIFVYRNSFFKAFSRWLDFAIVFLGWLDIAIATLVVNTNLPGAAMLRVFRLARLARAARLLIIFPELNSMIQGFASAMKAMVWGFLMLMVLLLIWSIVTVELVQPVNARLTYTPVECQGTFESVWETCVLFFQTLTAGDSWGKCSKPVIEEEPATFIVFAGSLVCVQLGFTNLIMSVIIDRATEAREKNVQARLEDKRQRMVSSRRRLFDFCEEMDIDGSGDIDVQEFIRGFDNMPEMRTCLELYGLERSDLPMLLQLMDEDKSGALSYQELVGVFEKVDHCDLRMQMMMTHLFLKDIGRRLESRLEDNEVGMQQIRSEISRHVSRFDSMSVEALERSTKSMENDQFVTATANKF